MKINSNIDLANILFFLAIVSGWLDMVSPSIKFTLAYFIFSLLLLFNELRHMTVYTKYLFFLIFFVSVLSLFKMFIDLPASIVAVFYFIIDCSLAHALIRGNIKPFVINTLFYMVAGFFFYQMFSGVDPELIFETSSRNAVSGCTLSAFMPLIFLYRQNKMLLPVIPAILLWILAMWGVGRSGILSSTAILIAILFSSANFNKAKDSLIAKTMNFYKIGMIILICLVLFYNIEEIASNAILKFMTSGLESDARSMLINAYFQNIEMTDFFIGIDLSTISEIAAFSENPHNYYLALHAFFGIIGFFMIISVFFYVITEMFKKNFLYAFIICAFLFRISTDSGMGIFSFIFLFLALHGFDNIHHALKKINMIICKRRAAELNYHRFSRTV